MPQGNDYFGDTKDALRMMIPLVINQRNIESNAIEQEKRLGFLRQQQEQETLRELVKLKKQQEDAQKKITVDMFLKAQEGQSDPFVQALGPQVESATGMQLPKYFESPTGKNKYSMFPQKPEKEGAVSPLGRMLKERDLLPEGDPRRKAYDDAIARHGKDPSTNVTIQNMPPGNQPPTKPTTNRLQSDVIDTQSQLGRLQGIKDSYSREFLQASGKVKGSIYKIGDYLNLPLEKLPGLSEDDKKKFLGQRTEFVTRTEQLFNLYRKEITGAAAAIQELDRLKKSMLNVDMTPMEFEHAYNAFEKELKRTIRLRNKFMRQGFDVRDPESGGKEFDSAMLSGNDDDPDARGAELEASISAKTGAKGEALKKAVAKQLEAEGYFD